MPITPFMAVRRSRWRASSGVMMRGSGTRRRQSFEKTAAVERLALGLGASCAPIFGRPETLQRSTVVH